MADIVLHTKIYVANHTSQWFTYPQAIHSPPNHHLLWQYLSSHEAYYQHSYSGLLISTV